MALKKAIELPSGAPCEYIRVTDFPRFDLKAQAAIVRVEGYVNAAFRLAGKEPVMGTAKDYYFGACYGEDVPAFPFTTEALESATPQGIVYTYLKTLPEFAGAEDC